MEKRQSSKSGAWKPRKLCVKKQNKNIIRQERKESEVALSCPTLYDLMDCSLPGSSVHGIFQSRVLEWGAISFFIHRLEDPDAGKD